MYHQYPQYYFSNLVPGTTAGTTSPGAMNYPAGIPTPVYSGVNAPPLAAAQSEQQQSPQTFDDVILNMQLQEGAVALGNRDYTQGYLRALIGKMVKAEFLLGESSFQDRIGVLLDVGIDYILLREIETDDDLLCDAYSIKYVMEYR